MGDGCFRNSPGAPRVRGVEDAGGRAAGRWRDICGLTSRPFGREIHMSEMNDFNQAVIEEFRANEGRVGGPFEGAPVLLLTSTGARSGEQRTTPPSGASRTCRKSAPG